jgi:exodeoxyribonuclease V gamma subunit
MASRRPIVHRSNEFFALTELLIANLHAPLTDVFAPETVIVPGPAHRKFIAERVAARTTVAGHFSFPFARAFVDNMVGNPASSTLELPWVLYDLLAQKKNEPIFSEVASYLGPNDGGQKRIALAWALAKCFDSYSVHRPAWVRQMERAPEPSDWQAVLLFEAYRALGRPSIATLVWQWCEASRAIANPFPERVSWFLAATPAPLFREVIAHLGAHTELRLYLLTASQEFLGTLQSKRDRARTHSEHHPLLSALGKVSGDFADVIEGELECDEAESVFVEPHDHGTRLASLQRSVFLFRSQTSLATQFDDSLVIHACHGARREVEVVRDFLCAKFEQDPTLQPHEVLILATHFDQYIPYIESVFSQSATPIPYAIAYRGHQLDASITAFFELLDAATGRLDVSAVFDLLSRPLLAERFGIALDELPRLMSLAAQAGVHWGLDAAHRTRHGAPDDDTFCWFYGLCRLLLGYAVADATDNVFHGVAPVARIEIDDADNIGKLADFVAKLRDLSEAVRSPRSIAEWVPLLSTAQSTFFGLDAGARRFGDALTPLLQDWQTFGERQALATPIAIEEVQFFLEQSLTLRTGAMSASKGGVVVSQLGASLGLPARVTCIVGMNDSLFPRSNETFAFDKLAEKRERGDPNRREEDRHAFLFALLASRRYVCITYIGESEHDRQEIPPSTCVTDLVDSQIDPVTDGAREKTVQGLVWKHPQKAWSPRNFAQPLAPYAFDAIAFLGAQSLEASGARKPQRSFVAGPLASTFTETKTASAQQIIDMLRAPAATFLKGLAVRLSAKELDVEDRDALEASALVRNRLGSQMLRGLGEGLSPTVDLYRARALLPPGTLGQCAFGPVSDRAKQIFRPTLACEQKWFSYDVNIYGVSICGQLQANADGGRARPRQVVFWYGELKPKVLLKVWVEHLLRNTLAQTGVDLPVITDLIGGEDPAHHSVRLLPIADAQQVLEPLVHLYLRGRSVPLRFLPQASFDYQERIEKDATHQAAIDALDLFSKYDEPEGADPAVIKVFGDLRDERARHAFFSLTDEQAEAHYSFADLAAAIYRPLFECKERLHVDD